MCCMLRHEGEHDPLNCYEVKALFQAADFVEQDAQLKARQCSGRKLLGLRTGYTCCIGRPILPLLELFRAMALKALPR